MSASNRDRSRCGVLLLVFCLSLSAGCGDDDPGPDDSQTGASLQGTVVAFDAGQAAVVPALLAAVGTPGVRVAIGSKSTETDAAGNFSLDDIAVGDQTVAFSRDDATGAYLMRDIEPGETFFLDQIQYSGGQIVTKHTGTWVGTADSTDPESVGLIALEMVLNASGNSLTGSATAEPETSIYTVNGTETGFSVDGSFTVVSSDSQCTADVSFEGTFVADTLSGTFVEVDPPADCGPPETGTFRVVKQ
jgi:hypothetical protein